jgi:hypothetical protein
MTFFKGPGVRPTRWRDEALRGILFAAAVLIVGGGAVAANVNATGIDLFARQAAEAFTGQFGI